MALYANGYPKQFIERRCKKILKKELDKELNSKPSNEEQCKGYETIPYIQGSSEKIKRVLQHGLKVMQRPMRTLGDVISRIKDKVNEKETGVVYSIPCKDCNVQYIGQTGRAFLTMMDEHISNVKSFKTEKSALAEHSYNLNHEIAWDEASILLKERQEQQRLERRLRDREQERTAQLLIEIEGGFSPICMYRFCQNIMNIDLDS